MKPTIDGLKKRLSLEENSLRISRVADEKTPTNSTKGVMYEMISDMGKVRNNNEDTCAVSQFHLFKEGHDNQILVAAVADGMGGLESGEKASYTAISEVMAYLSNDLALAVSTKNKETLLEFAIRRANDKIMEFNAVLDADRIMGTTMVLAMVIDSTLYFAHSGDSVIFHYNGKLSQANQIHRMKNSNALFSCLGLGKDMKVETGSFPLSSGESFLLCSDGLTDMVKNPQIKKIIASEPESPLKVVEDLKTESLNNGGIDNISIVYGFMK